MGRPNVLNCEMTPNIISRVREDQRRYDDDPELYERRERERKEAAEREEYESRERDNA